jgi:hypothetical protein
VSDENVPVTAVVKTTKGFKFGGAIFAEPNCWSMLKGGLIADTTGAAELYFEVLHLCILVFLYFLLNGKLGVFLILQNAGFCRAIILLRKFGSTTYPCNHSQKSNGGLINNKVSKR